MRKTIKFILALMMVLSMALNGQVSSLKPVDVQAEEEATYTQEEVVEFAEAQYGKPYVFGMQGPSAFDCTGFVKYVYNHFGVSVPRGTDGYEDTAYQQYGTKVSISNLQSGDIVLYGTSSSNVTHAAIYVGNGLIINALNPSYGVVYNYVTSAAAYEYAGYNTFALTDKALYGVRPFGRIANMGTRVDLGHSFTAEIEETSTKRLVTQSSTNVILAIRSEERGKTQKWLFTRTSEGAYYIQSAASERALDVTGGYLSELTPIKNVTLNKNLKRQKFYVQKLSDGSYILRPMISSQKVLSIVEKRAVLLSFTKDAGQCFNIIKTDQISVRYSANGGSGSVGTTLMNFGKVLTLKSGSALKRSGYTFRGWYAYRDADKKYYCGNTHKWQTEEAIKKYGYKKTIFEAGAKRTMNYNWVKSKYGLQTITMKASWAKNT